MAERLSPTTYIPDRSLGTAQIQPTADNYINLPIYKQKSISTISVQMADSYLQRNKEMTEKYYTRIYFNLIDELGEISPEEVNELIGEAVWEKYKKFF